MGGPILVTHAVLRTPADPARFGYIVSKKVGNAVTRNLITRRLRGISEALLHEGFSGFDVVFRVQPPAASASYERLEGEVRRQVTSLMKKAER